MSTGWPFTAEKIGARLQLIAPLIHRRQTALPPFKFLALADASLTAPICADPTGWTEIPHESYWGQADLNFVLKTTFQVPQGWHPDRLALHLPLGVLGDIFNHPEALVYVDGHPIGSADRYHHTLPLDPGVADGEHHILSLHGWTGLAGWPPAAGSKAKLFMGTAALVERDPALLSFVDLAQSAYDTLSVLSPEQPERAGLLGALDGAFKILDTRDPLGAAFYDSVPPAYDALQSRIPRVGAPLDVTLHAIGHAHMDIAYLWPISQIRLKNARTYTNVLRLMDEDPKFHFSHSQPQLYAMTAQDHPALFARIKQRVTEGRWEVMGGMWVEPDVNLAGPEALVRQLTLGRKYFHDTFGDVETPVLWLPDTFGFPGQIPQLMQLAGLKWFVTNKLNWNQSNKVPWSSHIWEGIDGSRVLAHILTTPRDVQYLPFPTNYKSDLSAKEVLGTWTNATQQAVRDLPICFGYGDGGGGPTEALLAKARAFRAMPGMPRVQMSTVRDTFEKIEESAHDLPVWRGEHYLELHRGVYTSQGWIKRANRKAEWALHEAEALSAMAGLSPDLTQAWQLLCLNQFHDILTGTSVPQVFTDARADFDRIFAYAETAAAAAADKLRGAEPVILNTSPVSGPRIATVGSEWAKGGQPTTDGVLLHFENLDPYSATLVGQATTPPSPSQASATESGFALENSLLLVEIAKNGQLTRVFDKEANRDVLAPGQNGNQLQAFEDRPIAWDAWDIDPDFEDRMEVIDAATSCEILENGPIRSAVRITSHWRSSTITQTFRLSAHCKRLDIVTDIDWHETHILLKAAFPTSVHAPNAVFDIQWGRIARATTRESAFDAARFEVPAQKWAQIAQDDYAVALLNDCKYGYDVLGNTLRISLIKSATSPDPTADQGTHVFTYSLLPINGLDNAALNAAAYDLNAPLRVVTPAEKEAAKPGCFISCDAPQVILETLKPAADGDGFVVRLFETKGQPAQGTLTFSKQIKSTEICDLHETPLCRLTPTANQLDFEARGFEIITLKLT